MWCISLSRFGSVCLLVDSARGSRRVLYITRCDQEIMLQHAEFNSGDRTKTYGDFAGSSLFSAKISCFFFFLLFQIRSSIPQWIYPLRSPGSGSEAANLCAVHVHIISWLARTLVTPVSSCALISNSI
ncbi:hypothetical protein H4582DRAFT_458463 [Lactarius indigo]|nr:hypothetical protein H4582DRAFT_458463 [Lactarius indigo]